MSTDKPYVYHLNLVSKNYNQPVFIATNIENSPVVTHKIN
jgi:uncharacterized phosphosugar-binding protein